MSRVMIAIWVLLSLPCITRAETVILSPAAQARAGVVLRPVQERAFGDQIRVLGQAVRAPGATTTIKSILEGRLERLLVAPGDSVQRNQPLVELHSHMLHQLQGQLMADTEALRLAEARLEAGRQLLEVEGISRVELDSREHEALAARVAVKNGEAELDELGYSLAEIDRLLESTDFHPVLTVRAPTAGVVLQVSVEQYAWVQAYDPLVVIGDPESLELELQLPPDDASGIRQGDLVEYIPVGRPEAWGLAKVTTRVPQVDATTRTVMVRAQITHGSENLLPGVFVEGNLIRGAASQAPSVPESAVIRMGSSDYVFVRVDPETFEARPVQVGRFNGTRFEIREGLALDEEVAVEGVFLLKSALLRSEEE
jgi:cobalt-zinc-cadmium efflux system membrane fusion protein